MPDASATAGIKRDVLILVAKIPAGCVATYGRLGQELNVAPRLIASLLMTLPAAERDVAPWWRVVADGGAIGRHKHRDEQIARLRAEGVPVAPAGIVGELTDRAVRDFNGRETAAAPASAPSTTRPASRSRGMKSHL